MNNDLISRENLKKHYSWWANGSEEYQEFKKIFDIIINQQPTVDAVEVVRCKDCKYYKRSKVNPNRKMCCRKDVDGWFVCYDFYPTDYCSYGERREDG